jgi:hypothetical protein
MGNLAGRTVIQYGSNASSKDLSVTAGALSVGLRGVNVSNSAIQVVAALSGVNVSNSAIQVVAALTGVQVSLSSLQVIDNTPASLSKAVSLSTGTIKASAGTLFTVLPTTSGDINIMDGTTSVARIAVVAATPREFGPWGIPFTTNISISASAAVATYVFK